MKSCLLAALVLAGSLGAQDSPRFSLRCRGPVREGTRHLLHFEGAAALPDRTQLMGSLHRSLDHWEAGKLKNRLAEAGGFKTWVKRGSFIGRSEVAAPGLYRCRVELLDDNQNEAVRPLVLHLDPKAWTRHFHAFDDAVVRDLEPRLAAVEDFAGRALALLKDFEKATATEETWKAAKPEIEPRLEKLRNDLAGALAGAVYPAALTELHSTIEVAHQNLPYVAFKDGAFDGANDYHGRGQKVKTHRGELYGHEAFRRCAEEAPAVAGRELALWIINDVRRSEGLRAETAELLKRLSAKPGVAEFAERLAAVGADGADALEKDVRNAGLEAPPKDN